MKISVIIPVYNSSDNLSKCLKSIFSGSRIPDEVIVVDDASTECLDLPYEYSILKLIRNEENGGPGHARNLGVKESHGDILLFIDSDVEIGENDVEKVENYFFIHKEITALSGSFKFNEREKGFFSLYKSSYMEIIHQQTELRVNFVLGAFCAIRRKSLVYWNEKIKKAEDTFWGSEICSEGGVIHFLKDIRVHHNRKFTFFSLVANDFLVAMNFVIPYLDFKNKFERKEFSHVSKNQIYGVKISLLFFLFLILGHSFISLILLALWLKTQYSLINKIYMKIKVAPFLIVSFWCLLTSLVHGLGVLIGFFYYYVQYQPKNKGIANERKHPY